MNVATWSCCILQAGEKDLRAQQRAQKEERLAAKQRRQQQLDDAWGSD